MAEKRCGCHLEFGRDTKFLPGSRFSRERLLSDVEGQLGKVLTFLGDAAAEICVGGQFSFRKGNKIFGKSF